MNTDQRNTKKWILIFVILYIILAMIVTFVTLATRKKTPPSGSNNHTVVQSKSIPAPQPITSTITTYLQAQEDAIGVDQSSPIAWLATVQPLSTADWFSQLQPNPAAQTGSVSNDYQTAHDNDYVVRANVKDCSLVSGQALTDSSATSIVSCTLIDTTFDQKTHTAVDPSTLPFGWVHSGAQSPPTITLIKQNNVWLISNVTTDQQTSE